jgi:hypothetical protein
MFKILFHTNHLSERGTEVALYDYAYFNELMLGNTSYICAPKIPYNSKNENSVIIKFNNSFSNKVFLYDSFDFVDKIIEENNIDIFYTIKSGVYDGILSKKIKNCVHVVFQNNQPHGDVYAYISEWLSKIMTNNIAPYVPHMINLPMENSNLREELGIPINSVVFGRYGGYYEFNIPFVIEKINKIVKRHNNIYFLFMNTDKNQFIDSKQIIFLKKNVDAHYKVRFINTCDAMIHARFRGESFGLSIGEFSIKNKPIITWDGFSQSNPIFDGAHLEILNNNCYLYNENNLYDTLINFIPDNIHNWDMYSEKYSPTPIMKKFKDVFIN